MQIFITIPDWTNSLQMAHDPYKKCENIGTTKHLWKARYLLFYPPNLLGNLMEAIKRDFGSFDNMKEKLSAASVGVQGSGWGWLVSVVIMLVWYINLVPYLICIYYILDRRVGISMAIIFTWIA